MIALNRKHLIFSMCLCVFLIVIFCGRDASAYRRLGKWPMVGGSPCGSPQVLLCADTIVDVFPSFDRAGVIHRIRDAMTEWNRTGASSIQATYAGEIPDTDPRCVASDDQQENTDGFIVVTAAAVPPSGRCNLGGSDTAVFGDSPIESAQVRFYKNGGCGDPDFSWALTDHVDVDTIDFGTVALHEFGHALGMDHSTVHSAVMFGGHAQAVGDGHMVRRLMSDDVFGLRDDSSDGYGRAPDRHVDLSGTSDEGKIWETPSNASASYITSLLSPLAPSIEDQWYRPPGVYEVLFAYVGSLDDKIRAFFTDLGASVGPTTVFDGTSAPEGSTLLSTSQGRHEINGAAIGLPGRCVRLTHGLFRGRPGIGQSPADVGDWMQLRC